MCAVLLPFSGQEIDWAGLGDLVERTLDAGLVPAVNMDTGHGQLIGADERSEVLRLVARATGSRRGPFFKPEAAAHRFVSGVHVHDQPDSQFDADGYGSGLAEVVEAGGTPIVFPSWGLSSLRGRRLQAAYRSFGEVATRFLGFELATTFVPEGRIWTLGEYASILEVEQCAGAKHSSLVRLPEWERLALRNRVRPDFLVLTGNDLAIDMVVYGSDWLLGLGIFAPDAFALRDRLWAEGDPGFWEVNDLLQFLGHLAFRPPVSAYKHDAARFLAIRGWIGSSDMPVGAPRRPDDEAAAVDAIYEEIVARLEDVLARHRSGDRA